MEQNIAYRKICNCVRLQNKQTTQPATQPPNTPKPASRTPNNVWLMGEFLCKAFLRDAPRIIKHSLSLFSVLCELIIGAHTHNNAHTFQWKTWPSDTDVAEMPPHQINDRASRADEADRADRTACLCLRDYFFALSGHTNANWLAKDYWFVFFVDRILWSNSCTIAAC